jgi:hypothetical protein
VALTVLINPMSHPESLANQPTVITNITPLEELKPCLPKNELKSIKLLAAVEFQGKSYYWYSFIRNIDHNFDGLGSETIQALQKTVIMEDKLGCIALVPAEVGLKHSLTLYLPEILAKQLALVSQQNAITEYGSKEKYLKAYDEVEVDGGTGPWIFFPETVWAFQQLGMKLPKNSVVAKTWQEVGY